MSVPPKREWWVQVFECAEDLKQRSNAHCATLSFFAAASQVSVFRGPFFFPTRHLSLCLFFIFWVIVRVQLPQKVCVCEKQSQSFLYANVLLF